MTISDQEKIYLLDSINTIKDFPKPGIDFKDISSLLANPEALTVLMDILEKEFKDSGTNYIAGLESRGFIFGAMLADRLKIPFVLVRKAGKLPGETISLSYELEYGSDTIEIQAGAFDKYSHVLVIDDLLATGGTAAAAIELIKKATDDKVAIHTCFVMELMDLKGRDKISEEISTVLEI